MPIQHLSASSAPADELYRFNYSGRIAAGSGEPVPRVETADRQAIYIARV